jgi:hypothetical protein
MTDYTFGFLEGNIHDFLLAIDRPPAGMKYALITTLDSCSDVARLLKTSEALTPLRDKASVVGAGLLLSTRHLLRAEQERRIFYGFDEVWFMPRQIIRPKPPDLTLVGPGRPSEATIASRADWLKASGCSLALGDGTGLNFVVKASGPSKLLLVALKDSVHV